MFIVKWRIELYKQIVSGAAYLGTFYPKDTADKDTFIGAIKGYKVHYQYTTINYYGVITQHYTVDYN